MKRQRPADDVAVFPRLTPAERDRFQQLQTLHDAIAYRAARLAAPCPDCGPRRCDDHAVDVKLIAAYRQAAGRAARGC